jgi:hypothetical protein
VRAFPAGAGCAPATFPQGGTAVKKTLSMTALAFAAALTAVPAMAQEVPVSFEMRLDAGIPVQDTDEVLDAGVGFGLRVSLDLAPAFSVYGGWSRMELELADDDTDGEVEEDGFEVGGRIGLGHSHHRRHDATPYFLMGALFRDDDTGIEAGLGAEYPVSWHLSVTPEVRYRSIDDLEYLTLGIGARVRF